MPRKRKKNPAAVALAKRRMHTLSPERRREIAKHAIEARWAKVRRENKDGS